MKTGWKRFKSVMMYMKRSLLGFGRTRRTESCNIHSQLKGSSWEEKETCALPPVVTSTREGMKK
jgi:hypothetical protein